MKKKNNEGEENILKDVFETFFCNKEKKAEEQKKSKNI